jgi:RNA polymerase sigma-70 factor (ECF subfamily)
MDHDIGTEETDEHIAAQVQGGNTEAFGALVDRYLEKMRRYGRKFLVASDDVEDLVQEIFIKAYQNIKSFDTTLRFSPWIYRIAHNVYIDFLRKGIRNPLVYVDFDTFLAHPVYEDHEHSASQRRQMREEVEHHLQKLDAKYREVLILYFLEDMAYKEISEILSVPISTVAIRLKRGKEALAKLLKEVSHGK